MSIPSFFLASWMNPGVPNQIDFRFEILDLRIEESAPIDKSGGW